MIFVLKTEGVCSVPSFQPFPGGDLLVSQLGKGTLSLASPGFILIYPCHVGGMLRVLVNNQRKMSQAFGSPFIFLITLFLMSYIFLTFNFLCSCPLRCYSQF